MRRTHKSFYRLNLGITNCYLLRCPEGYLLIDTAYPDSYRRFRRAIDSLGVELDQIRYLLLTHHHDDHAGFAARLVAETGCTTVVHRDALPALSRGTSEETMKPVNRCIKAVFALFHLIHPDFSYPGLTAAENGVLVSGDNHDFLKSIGIDGKILHTPGHTADSICLLVDDAAFTGDTLFVGKVGGTDLGDGARTEYASLHDVLMKLPDETRVFPGHDVGITPDSTIGRERAENPFLLREDLEAFVDLKRNWAEYKKEHGIA